MRFSQNKLRVLFISSSNSTGKLKEVMRSRPKERRKRMIVHQQTKRKRLERQDQLMIRLSVSPMSLPRIRLQNSRSVSDWVEGESNESLIEHARAEKQILDGIRRLGRAIRAASSQHEGDKLFDEAVAALGRYREFCDACGYPFWPRNMQAQNMLLNEISGGKLKSLSG
ncbi:hypothetical protein TRVA0_034S00804 [Trichomonascus vanleenenianus]|uniref:uncharacterized protein n=1 Tax=Trichomonascus vanleenenianus TaxID=2268995 RepID=UPI003ECA9493